MGGQAHISPRLRKSIAVLGVLLFCGTAWVARTETPAPNSPPEIGDIFSVLNDAEPEEKPPGLEVIKEPIAGKDHVFAARPSPYLGKHPAHEKTAAKPPQKKVAMVQHAPQKKKVAAAPRPKKQTTVAQHGAQKKTVASAGKPKPEVVSVPMTSDVEVLAARPSPYTKTASATPAAQEKLKDIAALSPAAGEKETPAAKPTPAKRVAASAPKPQQKAKPVVVSAAIPAADKALALRHSPYQQTAANTPKPQEKTKPEVAAKKAPEVSKVAAAKSATAKQVAANAPKTPEKVKSVVASKAPAKQLASADAMKSVSDDRRFRNPNSRKVTVQRELKLPAASALAAAKAIKLPNRALPAAMMQVANSTDAAVAVSLNAAHRIGEHNRAVAQAASELAATVRLSKAATMKVAALATVEGSTIPLANNSVTNLSMLSPAAGQESQGTSLQELPVAPPGAPAPVAPAAVMELPLPPVAPPDGTVPNPNAPKTLVPPQPAITTQPLAPNALTPMPQPLPPAASVPPQPMPALNVPVPAAPKNPALPPTVAKENGIPAKSDADAGAASPVAPALSDQSRAIVDSLPPEKAIHDEDGNPVHIEHARSNPLEGEDVRRHEGTGISISVHQPKPNITHMLNKAYDALLSGNQEDAVQLYREVLDEQPENKLALFGLATTYHRAGQLQLARPLYGRLLAIDPNNAEGLNNFLVLLADESPQDALAEMQKLQRTHPDFSPLPAQMAVIYERAGDMEAAVKNMKHAIDLSPENLKYRYDMAIMLDKAGAWDEAAGFYQQLLTASDRGEKIPAKADEIQERLTFIRSNKPKAQAVQQASAQPVPAAPSETPTTK